VAQVVECLPSKSEALSSNPSTTKNKNRKTMKATAYFENMPTLSLKKDRILYLMFFPFPAKSHATFNDLQLK
jgi:hypothetical protein